LGKLQNLICELRVPYRNVALKNLRTSYQNNNPKSFRSDYIYRIYYKNAKKGKPYEKDLSSLKNDIAGSESTFKMTDT